MLKFALIFTAGYLTVLLGVIGFQRCLVYFPHRDYLLTPRDTGLAFDEVFLTTEDGTQICAWLVPAAAAEAPTVLYLHGNGSNLGDLVQLACGFHELGFTFAAVDFRGYGKSAGNPTEAGLYQDGKAAYRWLTSKGIPPSRIFIYGQSLGGAVAAWLAAREPSAGLILEGVFPSLHASARHHYFFLFIPEAAVRDRFPTAENAAKAKCPVLVVHGEKDMIAPFDFGKRVFAAAREPKFFCPVPGAGHNDITPLIPPVSRSLEEFRSCCLARR